MPTNFQRAAPVCCGDTLYLGQYSRTTGTWPEVDKMCKILLDFYDFFLKCDGGWALAGVVVGERVEKPPTSHKDLLVVVDVGVVMWKATNESS